MTSTPEETPLPYDAVVVDASVNAEAVPKAPDTLQIDKSNEEEILFSSEKTSSYDDDNEDEDGIGNGDDDEEHGGKASAVSDSPTASKDVGENNGPGSHRHSSRVWNRTVQCWHGCWASNPRLFSVFFRIIIPMSILLGSALLGGWALSRFESPAEYDQNDETMVARFLVESLDVNGTANLLTKLPLTCLDNFLNTTLPDGPVRSELVDFDGIPPELTGVVDESFILGGTANNTLNYLWKLRQSMLNCTQRSRFLADIVRRLADTEELAKASSDLTFRWGRCWNTSLYGPYLAWRPTEDQVDGAKSQGEFYAAMWKADQQRLYQQYLSELGDNANIADEEEALYKSLDEATGRGECVVNRSGSCWFFFTVMTTVGYGNQAPITAQGRALTAGWGFACILMFAAILSTAGGIISLIYADLVNRFHLTFLSRPFMTTTFWCLVTWGWSVTLAEYTFRWWRERLEPEDVPTRLDAQWFSYISTATIGLGDFFLEPQVLFIHDAFVFSFIFLTGFAFFAAFLTSLNDFIVGFFPERSLVLQVQLQEANFIPGEKYLKKGFVTAFNALPFVNMKKTKDHDVGEGTHQPDDDHGTIDEASYLEELTQLSTEPTKTLPHLKREEELLMGLLEFKKRERINHQFIRQDHLKRQQASRHLEVFDGAEVDDETSH